MSMAPAGRTTPSGWLCGLCLAPRPADGQTRGESWSRGATPVRGCAMSETTACLPCWLYRCRRRCMPSTHPGPGPCPLKCVQTGAKAGAAATSPQTKAVAPVVNVEAHAAADAIPALPAASSGTAAGSDVAPQVRRRPCLFATFGRLGIGSVRMYDMYLKVTLHVCAGPLGGTCGDASCGCSHCARGSCRRRA